MSSDIKTLLCTRQLSSSPEKRIHCETNTVVQGKASQAYVYVYGIRSFVIDCCTGVAAVVLCLIEGFPISRNNNKKKDILNEVKALF